MNSEINSWPVLSSDPEACLSHSLCPPLGPGQWRARTQVFNWKTLCLNLESLHHKCSDVQLSFLLTSKVTVPMKTYQSVIKAESADVIGGDVALSEWLRYLGHNTALIYKDKLRH